MKKAWPGIRKLMEELSDPNSVYAVKEREKQELKAMYEKMKQEQIKDHKGKEGRMAISPNKTIAVIDSPAGVFYFTGIPREYL